MTKPFSQACENNKWPILNIIKPAFRHSSRVLEIGSGTGQHAVFFAAHMPHLQWQPTDVAAHLTGIHDWVNDAALNNVQTPLALDVSWNDWPIESVDAVFSANTFHIMPWSSVQLCMTGIGRYLQTGGMFCLYGPFNYGGSYTSDSNAQFDKWLKLRDPDSAIRNFEDVLRLATDVGLELLEDHAMPANNRLLVFVRRAG